MNHALPKMPACYAHPPANANVTLPEVMEAGVRGKIGSLFPLETDSAPRSLQRNPRHGGGRPMQAFLDIMANLDLPYPKFIDFALPGNRACGVCPEDIPEHLQEYCDRISNSRQG
jgi:hypothetical protein